MTSQRPPTADASWTVPGSLFTVTYSVGLLREIEFAVNEGYRRIPHGGVETGGLLFGRVEENSTCLQAFRFIECEHASGPSFVLSEHDLNTLRQQLAAVTSDPELEGMQLVGWFIAHTRSQLQLTDREHAVFEQLFPGPGRITLLVKPERFQPTRFAFLVRRSDGQIDRDGTRQATVLPLSGRPSRFREAPPAPPAEPPPFQPLAPQPLTPQPLAPEHLLEAPAPPAEPKPIPAAEVNVTRRTEAEPKAQSQAEPEPQPEPVPVPVDTYPAQPVISPDLPLAIPPPESPAPLVPQPSPAAIPFADASALPSIEEIKRRRSEHLRGAAPHDTQAVPQAPGQLVDARTTDRQVTRKTRQEGNRFNLRLAAALVLAAALGSGVGYWAYLQLGSPTIPLTVHVGPAALLVSWPPEQTRDAPYAAIHVDNALAIPLSAEEKAAGQAEIKTAADDVKIELFAQHWMRESRGFVRYVRAAKPPPPPPLPETPKRRSRRE